MLVKPDHIELSEECQEVNGLTEETLTEAEPLEEAIEQVIILIQSVLTGLY